MRKLITPIATLFIVFWATTVWATDARVLAPLEANGAATIVGEANGSWYVSILDYSKKTTDYQVNVYPQGNGSMKHYKLETNWGEYSGVVKSIILNNKFCVFFLRYDKRPGQTGYYNGSVEGTQAAAPKVFMQEYDLATFKAIGAPETVLDAGKDGFGLSGFDLASSEDGSKTALIFKSTLAVKKYKLMVYDNKTGLLYSKVYNQPEGEKEFFVPQFKISNDGALLLMAKGVSGAFFSTGPTNYYFTTVSNQGAASKPVKLVAPVGDRDLTPPVAQWVNGQVVVAYGYYKGKNSSDVVAMQITQYDANMKLLNKKEIPSDPKLMEQANAIEKGKDGFFSLRFNEILPLTGGNFALVTECHHTRTEHGDHFNHTISTQNYGIVYRFDDKLNVTGSTFLAKKQQGDEFRSFMFGIKPYHVGDDIYLIYAEDFKEGVVSDMQLFSMHIPAAGGPGVVQKLIKTTDGYLPTIEGMVSGTSGKLLTSSFKYKKGFYTGSVAGLNFIQVDCGSVKEH